MQRNYHRAYNQLRSIGAPVIEGGYNGEDTFRISGEDNCSETWADYYEMEYGEFGVSPRIVQVLNQHGLFAEWINPGVLAVCEI